MTWTISGTKRVKILQKNENTLKPTVTMTMTFRRMITKINRGESTLTEPYRIRIKQQQGKGTHRKGARNTKQ